MVSKGEVKKQVGEDIIVENDLLAVEAPLQIMVEWGENEQWHKENLSVTMRTPGHDFDLVRGYLWAEGLLSDPEDLQWIRYCNSAPQRDQGNVVIARWLPGKKPARPLEARIQTQHSSCGLCGKTTFSLDQQVKNPIEIKNHKRLYINILNSCFKSILELQTGFKFTGGFHGVGLFDWSGELLVLREDVGRHNAMDKVVGAALENPSHRLEETFVWLSGRVSYEMVQKAIMARIPLIAAVGAPTSLAVDLAKENGVTLIGFLREDRMNIYAHAERLMVTCKVKAAL